MTLLFCIIAISSFVSAATFTISPDSVRPGETISLDFAGLQDGSQIEVIIDGSIDTEPSRGFTYTLSDLVNNLGMANASISGRMEALVDGSSAKLVITRENGEKLTKMGSAIDRVWKTSISGSLTKATYNASMFGEAASSNTSVSVSLKGVKQGIDNAQCSFNLKGFTKGTFDILIKIDGNTEGRKTISVSA